MVLLGGLSCWFLTTMTLSWICGPGGESPSTVMVSWQVQLPAVHTATPWSAMCVWVLCHHHQQAQRDFQRPSRQTSSTVGNMRWTLLASATQLKPSSTPSVPCLHNKNAAKKTWSSAIFRAIFRASDVIEGFTFAPNRGFCGTPLDYQIHSC